MKTFREMIEGFTDNIKPKWTPPKGTFDKETSAEETANIVAKASDNYKQAVDRVEFYFNRAGNNLPDGKERAASIVAKLKKLFEK